MIAINFTTARGRLKDFCDRVTDRGETVIVTRKAEKNVVIISGHAPTRSRSARLFETSPTLQSILIMSAAG